MNPTISIIVPVWNNLESISTCLDTLVGQTLENLEVLIIDDCSERDVFSAILPYLNVDSRVHYYRNNTQIGPGGARNVGLSNAIGRYIGFCDSDDWVDFDYYQIAVGYMESYNADIGMLSLIRETNGSKGDKLYKCKYDQFQKLNPDTAFRIMTYQYDAGVKVIPPCTNKVFRRDFLTENSIIFEEGMYFQDVLFSVKAILSANSIICIPQTKYHHFRRINSIIQSFSPKHIDDFTKLFSLISEYLKSRGLYEYYCNNYYKLCDHFYGIIIREIFQFVPTEVERKRYIRLSFKALKQIIILDEYFEYATSEQIRQHLQPNIQDTTLY